MSKEYVDKMTLEEHEEYKKKGMEELAELMGHLCLVNISRHLPLTNPLHILLRTYQILPYSYKAHERYCTIYSKCVSLGKGVRDIDNWQPRSKLRALFKVRKIGHWQHQNIFSKILCGWTACDKLYSTHPKFEISLKYWWT